jgi:hypothetical protein
MNVIAVPEGLNKSVGEAERQHIVNRAFSEIVVDAKDVVFIEDIKKDLVQFLCGRQIVSEGFLYDDARRTAGIRLLQMFQDGLE